MKKILFTVLAILWANSIFCQKIYVQGYFVKNNGEKIECLIDNKDWESSPKDLFYKLSETSKPEKISTDSIRLFELPGYSKYICSVVQIDKSSEDIDNLSPQKNPVWQTEKLALNVLCEGKATLYMYRNKEITRFFYAINGDTIRQLVYKSYQASNANGTFFVGINNSFRQQLFVDVTNPKYKYDLSKLNYEEKELRAYFEQYNAQFETANSTPKKEKVKRDSFKAAVMVGSNISTLNVINTSDSRYSENFEPAISPLIGAEFEFTLPFFNNKWSLLVQPFYNTKIDVKTPFEPYPGQHTYNEFTYQGLDIPLGVRYRYSVNNNLKINASAYVTNGILSWSKVSIRVYNKDFDVSTVSSQMYSIGVGADYKKLGMELKYTGGQNFLKKYTFYSSEFNVVSLAFKYRLVDLKTRR